MCGCEMQFHWNAMIDQWLMIDQGRNVMRHMSICLKWAWNPRILTRTVVVVVVVVGVFEVVGYNLQHPGRSIRCSENPRQKHLNCMLMSIKGEIPHLGQKTRAESVLIFQRPQYSFSLGRILSLVVDCGLISEKVASWNVVSLWSGFSSEHLVPE